MYRTCESTGSTPGRELQDNEVGRTAKKHQTHQRPESVRGEQTAASDLDLLVSFREPVSLLEFVHLENHLSGMLGVKVDLVMKSALKPRIGKHILEEVVLV